VLTAILAAALSVQSLLASAEAFSTRVGIDIPRPLTTNLVTKFKINAGDDNGFVVIKDPFNFTCVKGKIISYIDQRENVSVILTRCDPAELKRWSEQKTLIDTNGALAIAREQFQRLGFKDEDFQTPSCHQYEWMPDVQHGPRCSTSQFSKSSGSRKAASRCPKMDLGQQW